MKVFEGSGSSGGGRQDPGGPRWAEDSSPEQAGTPGPGTEEGPDPNTGSSLGESVCDSVSPWLRVEPMDYRGLHPPRGPARGQSKKHPEALTSLWVCVHPEPSLSTSALKRPWVQTTLRYLCGEGVCVCVRPCTQVCEHDVVKAGENEYRFVKLSVRMCESSME